MSNQDEAPDGDRSHLDDIEGGVGCTEIWEKLSERREETAESAAADD